MSGSIPNNIKKTNAAIQAWTMGHAFGLIMTSGFRTAADAERVGSTTRSMHNTGEAFDFAGKPSNMKKFADWARKSGLFTEVLYEVADHYDHVHVGWGEGKHASGKTYVGNSTLIDKVGDGGGTVIDGAAGSGLSIQGSLFSGSLRLLLIVCFIVIGLLFFTKSFPVTDAPVKEVTNLVKRTVKKQHHAKAKPNPAAKK